MTISFFLVAQPKNLNKEHSILTSTAYQYVQCGGRTYFDRLSMTVEGVPGLAGKQRTSGSGSSSGSSCLYRFGSLATTSAEQNKKYQIETVCCLNEVEVRDGVSSGRMPFLVTFCGDKK